MPELQLSEFDVTLLIQSLDNCLASCQRKVANGKDAPCEDCDAARALRDRLAHAKEARP